MVFRAAIVFVAVISLLSSAALAEKRVALVIGNGAYANVGKLSNPGNDAKAMEALFRAAGFDVVEVRNDLGITATRRLLRDFADTVREADIAVVFYAGHGIEVNGTNYLIPVDATLERDIDVEDETVSLDRVLLIRERAKRLRLVILDACRDNPFMRSMKRTVGGRSIGRGLGKVDVLTSDTLIAFAAKHGSTAADGEGLNSPYTSALVQHLTMPGLDLRLALGKVRDDVLKRTSNRQEPFVYGSLGGAEIVLVPSALAPQQPHARTSPQLQLSEAAEAWDRVKDTANVAAFQAFGARYGNTIYGDLARLRMEEIKNKSTAEEFFRALGLDANELVNKRSPVPKKKTTYIANLSFVDGATKSALVGTDGEKLNRVVEDTITALAANDPSYGVNISGHMLPNTHVNNQKLNSIYWDPNLSRTEKIDRIINELMVPAAIDGLVSGQFKQNADGSIEVRPFVIAREGRNLSTETRAFKVGEYACLNTLCEPAIHEIRGTVVRLLKYVEPTTYIGTDQNFHWIGCYYPRGREIWLGAIALHPKFLDPKFYEAGFIINIRAGDNLFQIESQGFSTHFIKDDIIIFRVPQLGPDHATLAISLGTITKERNISTVGSVYCQRDR